MTRKAFLIGLLAGQYKSPEAALPPVSQESCKQLPHASIEAPYRTPRSDSMLEQNQFQQGTGIKSKSNNGCRRRRETPNRSCSTTLYKRAWTETLSPFPSFSWVLLMPCPALPTPLLPKLRC